jgi:serine/threonine protein kinase
MYANNWIGKSLSGRYQIQEILGQGGMSAVYKAVDTNLKRVVAIKLIHPHLSGDPTFIERFEDEAQAVAQLRHPNIIQVYDFNHDNDLYYMVQEYVAGETLQARLEKLHQAGKQMPLTQAVKYMIDICQAVGYAHERGMIHRDIKPANIMLDEQGKAVLMDFGIVKILGGEKHTATGAVIGTAAYMSPDVIRGEPPDARSDIYSLGVTLYEMVGGRPPFDADSVMTLMMKHLNEPVPDLSELRPDVPAELKSIIEKSLAKQREYRFGSAQDMAKALQKVLFLLESGAPLQPAPRQATSAYVAVNPPQRTPPPPPAYVQVNPSRPAPTPRPGIRPAYLIGGGAVLLLIMIACIAGAVFLLPGLLPGKASAAPGSVGQRTDPPTQIVVTELPPTPTATLETVATLPPQPTSPPAPTQEPTLAVRPTPTVPPGIPFVRINQITVDDQNRYVVEYETFEYTEKLPGMHVHFFFNTVPAEQAGVPGKGPWILYGGPRPFSGYKTSERPANASQMCALVANSNHSVQPDSGTCFPLPDVASITARQEVTCYSGPGEIYPSVTTLKADATVLLKGLAEDELWLNVQNPDQLDSTCWVPHASTFVQGDISQVPLAESPPTPVPNTLSVEITNITLDASGNYVVEFATHNFVPAIPGIHVHFYFNTTPVDQVGIGGGGVHKMFGSPSPFTGFGTLDRPDGATQICAIVVNPDHSIIPNSGSCFQLP